VEEIEQNLEGAWRAGQVKLSVVLGQQDMRASA
jgi:hypothetical protein